MNKRYAQKLFQPISLSIGLIIALAFLVLFRGPLFECPPLPTIEGIPQGAYFVCSSQDWACRGATARNVASRLSSAHFEFLYNPACFYKDVHPRVFFCGDTSTEVQGHPRYDASDVRIVLNAERKGVAASLPYGTYDIGITTIERVPKGELLAQGQRLQVYMPFIVFGVLQNDGLSELDLLQKPEQKGPGNRRFAAYASKHCAVTARNKAYTLLAAYRPLDALNKNCHGGLPPKEGALTDRGDESSWMRTIVERFKLYKFVVVFENAIVPGYVTEKLANAKKAGAVPVYYGSSMATELFNPLAFVDCSPRGVETLDVALVRCVADVKRLDLDDEAWNAMVQAPFMRNNAPFDYKPLANVVKGVLDCKVKGMCDGSSKDTICSNIKRSFLLSKAYFVPEKYGDCSS